MSLDAALATASSSIANALDADDAVAAAAFVGLPAGRIARGPTPVAAWRSVFVSARRRRQLGGLIDHLVEQVKDNPDLAAVLDELRQVVARTDDAGGILETGARQRPEHLAPSQLLDARYEVVPWHQGGREDVWAELDAWAEGAEASSVWLLHAEGGIGKTRLAIEWARGRRGAGWCAGFVPRKLPEGWADDLCAWGAPVLVVIDYAESRTDLTALLGALREAHATSGGPCV